MKMYDITILTNCNGSINFKSQSRNAKKHLQDNGGNKCIVEYKNNIVSIYSNDCYLKF